MAASTSEPEYDPHAWHDDTLHGMRFRTPDLVRGDWTSAFILDIDHIVAWVKEGDAMRFRVAPADLMFHDVCDLEMAIDWGDSRGQVGLSEPSIDRITRETVETPGTNPLAPLFRWRVVLNWPTGGEITFHARRYDLALRRTPVLHDEQSLSESQRS